MGRTPAPWEKGASNSTKKERKNNGLRGLLRPITNITEDIDDAVLKVAKPVERVGATGGLKLLNVVDKPGQAMAAFLTSEGKDNNNPLHAEFDFRAFRFAYPITL